LTEGGEGAFALYISLVSFPVNFNGFIFVAALTARSFFEDATAIVFLCKADAFAGFTLGTHHSFALMFSMDCQTSEFSLIIFFMRR
tara:strand:- start:4247 stop:4504 length:258 start_codon:yes stop_codon:yes gene_type:complete